MAETYYSLTEIVILCDNLVAARPSDDMWGILTVRNNLGTIPAADVVARDCFDKILADNDDMRAIIDTYGGLENIQSTFVKLHEIETADVRPVVRAQWIYDNANLSCTCPVCKAEYDTVSCRGPNYCPNCGARMDKDGDGE